jgi:serine/threonine-protein kinase
MAASKPISTERNAAPSTGPDAARSAADARLGQTLGGNWTLERMIGAGGSACVYAARHRNGRRVAIKLLHADLSRHARAARRFLSEGYAANKIPHPGVVQILDDGQEADGTKFLVMELLQGQSLAQRFEENGPLPPDEVASAAVGILDVLAAAHDAGIVHRDVKPSNIFRTQTGATKILDFGAARIREAEDFVTRSGTAIGTPAFMAPELAAGRVEQIDGRSDVWSVGATMFQLLTGRTPHAARSTHEALVTAATRPVPSIASIRADLPTRLVAAIDRALAFEMDRRWPNARAMQAELIAAFPDAASQRQVTSNAADSLPESARASHGRPRLGWVAAGIALVAFAVLAISAYAKLSKRAVSNSSPESASSSVKQMDPSLSVSAAHPENPEPFPAPAVGVDAAAQQKPAARVIPPRPARKSKPTATRGDDLDEFLDKRK